ncbi:nucleotidyltransferase [Chloroflexota bacterium]
MPIPDSMLGRWSHHYSGEAPKQSQLSIRDALDRYTGWFDDTEYKVFLQGSYKNDTNLRQDSDVDVVVQLASRLRPRVAALDGTQLQEDQSHKISHERWNSFRKQVLKALRATYGADVVTTGRKSLKLSKGDLPASADVVVTLRCGIGLAFYLSDEHRWVISYPQQHHTRGVKKERSTENRYKRTIRMFKAARNYLVKNGVISAGTASSYFIECLLYNVPNGLFKSSFGQSYSSIVDYLITTDLQRFLCQNGVRELFGPPKDLWNVNKAREFIQALRKLWENWPESA